MSVTIRTKNCSKRSRYVTSDSSKHRKLISRNVGECYNVRLENIYSWIWKMSVFVCVVTQRVGFYAIHVYVWWCKVHVTCMPMRIWCIHSAGKILRGRIWCHMYIIHREQYHALWVASKLFWVFLNAQVPNAML